MQITASEETTRNQFVFQNALNEDRLAGSQDLLSIFQYFSGFLIPKVNRDTSLGICDEIQFSVGPCNNVRPLQDLKQKLV